MVKRLKEYQVFMGSPRQPWEWRWNDARDPWEWRRGLPAPHAPWSTHPRRARHRSSRSHPWQERRRSLPSSPARSTLPTENIICSYLWSYEVWILKKRLITNIKKHIHYIDTWLRWNISTLSDRKPLVHGTESNTATLFSFSIAFFLSPSLSVFLSIFIF